MCDRYDKQKHSFSANTGHESKIVDRNIDERLSVYIPHKSVLDGSNNNNYYYYYYEVW